MTDYFLPCEWLDPPTDPSASKWMAPRSPRRKKVIILLGEYKAERIPNKGAVIHIVLPQDGTTFEEGSEVKVEIECNNFQLGRGDKHWRVYIDGQSPRLIMGKSKNVILRDLEPGQHQISTYLAVGSYIELEDGTTVTINVNRVRS